MFVRIKKAITNRRRGIPCPVISTVIIAMVNLARYNLLWRSIIMTRPTLSSQRTTTNNKPSLTAIIIKPKRNAMLSIISNSFIKVSQNLMIRIIHLTPLISQYYIHRHDIKCVCGVKNDGFNIRKCIFFAKRIEKKNWLVQEKFGCFFVLKRTPHACTWKSVVLLPDFTSTDNIPLHIFFS